MFGTSILQFRISIYTVYSVQQLRYLSNRKKCAPENKFSKSNLAAFSHFVQRFTCDCKLSCMHRKNFASMSTLIHKLIAQSVVQSVDIWAIRTSRKIIHSAVYRTVHKTTHYMYIGWAIEMCFLCSQLNMLR